MKMWTAVCGVAVSIALLVSGYYGYTVGAQIDLERQEKAVRQENLELYGTEDGSFETSTIEDENGNRFYLLLVYDVDPSLADYEHVQADGSTVFVKMARFYPPEEGMFIAGFEALALEYKTGPKDRLPVIKIGLAEFQKICSDIGLEPLETSYNLSLINS